MRPETGDEVVDALLSAAHRVRTRTDAELRAAGMSLARLKVLKLLCLGPAFMRDVGEALHIAPRTVTETIDGLESAGLVERRPDRVDRRRMQLTITPTGRARVIEAQARASRVSQDFTSGLDEADRDQLLDVLGRLGSGTPQPVAPAVGRPSSR
jgi:DNA-binding MarR family transcriptional regulator